ncbi:hypothetical protein ACFWPK_33445 [Nocardia sp. NPDC058519]
MTVIVVDTNLFCKSPKLRNPEWKSLLENREHLDRLRDGPGY